MCLRWKSFVAVFSCLLFIEEGVIWNEGFEITTPVPEQNLYNLIPSLFGELYNLSTRVDPAQSLDGKTPKSLFFFPFLFL